MSALPDIRIGNHDPLEPELPLVSEGVQRYVWESSFGPMLIEVKAGETYVNGSKVEPAPLQVRRPGDTPL